VSDLSELVWRNHELWLESRPRLRAKRDRWTDADWGAAKQQAETVWDKLGRERYERLFVHVAQRALYDQHWHRVEERLAFEARHDAAWLLGVLERTA
jgi:hypothetical protein